MVNQVLLSTIPKKPQNFCRIIDLTKASGGAIIKKLSRTSDEEKREILSRRRIWLWEKRVDIKSFGKRKSFLKKLQ
ncbi:MAG: hypothetical protein IJX77_01095, partial [Ruminococcus sp.]|nr:hypothetical protein [Ruminococcus sp.]